MDPAPTPPAAPGAREAEAAPAGTGAPPRDARTTWLVVVCVAVLTVPLLVALVALRSPRWYPLLDMAQSEIRVRDVTSSHPPLIGLAGRIGPYGPDGGSHPGPLSFYALWPVYRMFGATPFGLQAAQVALDVGAIALALWIARRRGGAGLVLAVAALLAVLMHTYGPFLLTLPWNPYLPVLWWVVFLLAVWSLTLDDFAMLPVAVFAGTLAMQTHIPYLGLVGGLGVFAVGWVAVAAFRRRRDRVFLRRLARSGLVGASLFAVLWLPPVVDEIRHEPGNLTTIREHFSDPPEDPIGVVDGVQDLLSEINPLRLVSETIVSETDTRPVSGSALPGAVLLGAFAISGVVAFRLPHQRLTRLHVVLAVATLLAVVSTARIFGYVWYYLLLWAWGLAALVLLAVGWTAVEVTRRALATDARPHFLRVAAGVGAAVLAVYAVLLAVDAGDTDVHDPRRNETLGRVVGPTVAAIERYERDGNRGPVLVTWLPDPLSIGGQGFGLLNELLREGVDARARMPHRPGVTRYHVAEPDEVGFEVHIATGSDIARWRADKRYEEVAYADARTDAEREEYEALRDEVIAELHRLDRRDLVPRVDDNLWALGIESGLPASIGDRVARMLEIGAPAAVFIGPPSGSV